MRTRDQGKGTLATRARKPSQAYHHGDLRRALIHAALELIEERGPDGWTLREAARRTGVSQTAPYRHFRDKNVLLAAVAAEGFNALSRGLTEVRKGAHTPHERARRLAHAYLQFAILNPAHFRVMFSGIAAQAPEGNVAFAEVQQLVRDGQHAGVIRSGNPRRLARTMWAAVHGVAALVVSGAVERAEGAHILRLTVNATLSGLAPGRH